MQPIQDPETGNKNVYFGLTANIVVTNWTVEAKLQFIVEMLNKGWVVKVINRDNQTIIYWGA